ncbi:glycosyltransferase family 90 protein [Baudoinia panamericana UAMH 10762]|uniref:Glycosyltransferase family 90 protein n=1 Tax=Baudoinia panamericana (strain UAMH 10762) TaxID=717646 RepID=M2N9C0_BAUPA|nr:glycosyltransferase family 90 protein [Baudoinia panamericana UAMH 10762]EMD00774.1 glycosyltransferase family 90 protein [Baudoinia panamericana UAMH 10762]
MFSASGLGSLSQPTFGPPDRQYGPLQYNESRTHPVDQLVQNAEASWLTTLSVQSQTLEAAVLEYKRRYGLPPPPDFDRWYEFAKRKGVQLTDEYDSIHHSLLPFWALPPATLRARVQEALGFGPNNLMGLQIRGGKAAYVEGGQEWLQKAVVGMIEEFVHYLPDMDVAFNVHDEPRVVVPHDQLSRLIDMAINRTTSIAAGSPNPRNAFSAGPADLKNNKRFAEVKTTRFNVFAHQPTWIPSRLSCSPDSLSRALGDLSSDNLTAYALGELGFVHNHTAFTDICNSPSFATSHGFFDRPNAFNVIHELFPIFSQSKMSSFQDILYPSPWYWYGKVAYDEKKDMDWQAKINSLFWRGSTTGGFSRDGGWRRQHRQKLVAKLNALDSAKIMQNTDKSDSTDASPDWKAKEVPRQDYKQLMDVYFSHVGQCDPGDCDAQREYFHIAKPVDQQDVWKYRFLLDMDGNAFSGRFYAFLKSRSLTFKMAVFREWHEEWIKPWVHYVPLSLRGDEALEVVRYMSAEEEGRRQAVRMAEVSQDWANKVLRNEDFEVWLFRLLLEYGRIMDDNRESIGYSGR